MSLYIGLDLSTQQLKALVINSDLKLIQEAKVDFDADLPHYDTTKGVHHSNLHEYDGDGVEVTAPIAMWLEAIDLVLSRLKEQGLDFSKVKGLSGAGMQHGTVFWNNKAEGLLANLDPSVRLAEQLQSDIREAFSCSVSPNWQDSSTQAQCELFDQVLGSAEALARTTGSSAHHRFSGPQIMRFCDRSQEAYARTSRISLVSSFITSIFAGKISPMDISDVCGANLWNIAENDWDENLLELAAANGPEHAATENGKDLRRKLGEVSIDGGAVQGTISSYFVDKYGFARECRVITATGDNPATILSLPLMPSDAIVSLGTSTTFLMSTPNYKPDPQYHFMNHPTTEGLYMFMLCYKNGGLAREHIRDGINGEDVAENSWEGFNEAALKSPVLGQGDESADMTLGLYFPLPEIVPNVTAGTWKYAYNSTTGDLKEITTEGADDNNNQEITTQDARTILESQFLSLRLRSKDLVQPQTHPTTGASLPAQPRRIYLVGGGSLNPAIAELAGQVLGGSEGIYRLDVGSNACALGAAYKAVWGCERRSASEGFEGFIGARWREEEFVRKIAEGYREGVWERYGEAVKGFAEMERRVVDGDKDREGESQMR